MAIVYRVHKRGDLYVGPMHYSGDLEGANWQLPGPRRDGIDFSSGYDYCACESIAQLLNWFGNCLLTLFRRNYVVSVIEIEDSKVKRGLHQVAIRLEDDVKTVKKIVSKEQLLALSFTSCSA